MGQLSFLSIAQAKKQLRRDKFLNRMDQIIPWERLYAVIAPFYVQEARGRKRKPLPIMLRIICLQQWYDLSDPAMEEEIYDRASFQKFLKLDLLADGVPDETTILKFRHLLEKNDLFRKIFEEINRYLDESGFIMQKGTIVDASIISAPTSTKNKEKKRDPEMSSTKKGNQWYFGMKAHIGVDASSGLVHSLVGTTAKAHDMTQLDNLLTGRERAIFGDKGYFSEVRKGLARYLGIYWGVLDKKKKNSRLSDGQEKRNKKLSRVRAKVEHPFQVVKHLWGHSKVRYRGLKKNTDQLYLLFGLFNLHKVRMKLTAP